MSLDVVIMMVAVTFVAHLALAVLDLSKDKLDVLVQRIRPISKNPRVISRQLMRFLVLFISAVYNDVDRLTLSAARLNNSSASLPLFVRAKSCRTEASS